jgi:hypothetical protein
MVTASRRFEWTMVGLGTALMCGAYLDSWAHGHLNGTLETFFTPWHALLYSAMLATTVFLVVAAAWTGARPWRWARALPDGYALSLAGCFAFAIGGVLDLAWHLTFGIERSFQALISPTHVLLMASGGMIVSGPLRAAWRRAGRRIGWPAVVSAMLLLSMLTFFGQDTHPYTQQWSALPQPAVPDYVGEQLGIVEVLFQTALLMGVVLLLVRRFDLPPGSLTFLFTANALFVVLVKRPDAIILVALVAGVAADVLLVALRPGPDRPAAFRAFAFVVPAVLYTLYFAALLRADGLWWPVPVWAGAPVLAGLTGWLLSLLVLPAGAPEPAAAIPSAAHGRM